MESKKLSESANLAPESPFGEAAKEASYLKTETLVGQDIAFMALAVRDYDGDTAYRFLAENSDGLLIEFTTSSAAFSRVARAWIEQGEAQSTDQEGVYTLPMKVWARVGEGKNDRGQRFFTLGDAEDESDE